MALDAKSLTREELAAQFERWEQPSYRIDQVLEWIYQRRATGWDLMTNLPKALREQLEQTYTLTNLELLRLLPEGHQSHDVTHKFLWRLADHSLIESVLIPANPALY